MHVQMYIFQFKPYTPSLLSLSFLPSLAPLYKGMVVSGDDRLAVVVEELQDLKGVWQELGKIWEQVDELRDKPWLSVQPRKVKEVRERIDVLLRIMHFRSIIIDSL